MESQNGSMEEWVKWEDAFAETNALDEATAPQVFALQIADRLAAFKIEHEGRLGNEECIAAGRLAGELAAEMVKRLVEKPGRADA